MFSDLSFPNSWREVLTRTDHPTKLGIPETAMCQNNDRAFTQVSTVSDLIILPDNPTIG